MKKTKKNFKMTLNNWYNNYCIRNFRNGKVTRGYGDYLYSQDRIMFEILFNKWQPEDTQRDFENK